MCSSETQELGIDYTDTLVDNCCDNRDDYFPFYEAVVEWIKKNGNIVAEVESWPEVNYVEGPVPLIIFHPDDNAQCRSVVSRNFDFA